MERLIKGCSIIDYYVHEACCYSMKQEIGNINENSVGSINRNSVGRKW
jgi:hypothetical protein